MSRPYLVVVRAGDESLHPGWNEAGQPRNWDLVVSYFGDDPQRYRNNDCTRIDHKGSKWQGLAQLFDGGLVDLARYRYILLPDDDLAFTPGDLDRFFVICEQLGIELAQPSLSWSSHVSHAICIRNPEFAFRYVNFIEVMAPCFRRDLLERVRHTFAESHSGWGLDYVWPTWMSEPVGGAAIIDAVAATHTRPVGGPNYAHLSATGGHPLQEMQATLARHGIRDTTQVCYGGQATDGRMMSLWHGGAEFVYTLLHGLTPVLVEHPAVLGGLFLSHARYQKPLAPNSGPLSAAQFTATEAHGIAAVASQTLFGKGPTGYDIDVVHQLLAAVDSARYREERMRNVTNFPSAQALLEFALKQAPHDGLFLEFGVAGGRSLRQIAAAAPTRVYGFDSFDGLPETWRPGFGAGRFRQPRPAVIENAELVEGMFDQSLPAFLANHPEPVAFAHIDCDLYASTHSVLMQLAPRLQPGAILVFDEYFNFPGWRHDEFRAFQEFIATGQFTYEYIGLVSAHQQVAVRLLGVTAA